MIQTRTPKKQVVPVLTNTKTAKVNVLVVGPPALSRVVKHLLAPRQDFEVVGSLRGLKGLAPQAERLLPKLIVARTKPVTTAVGLTVRSIKRASPSSRLILLCPVGNFVDSARRFGADACLDPEKLIAQLLPTACALSAGFGDTSVRGAF